MSRKRDQLKVARSALRVQEIEKKSNTPRKKKPKPEKRRTRIPLRAFIKATRGTAGLVAEIAKRLGCRPVTVYAYMTRHPEAAQAVHEAREEVLDLAENAVAELIKKFKENPEEAGRMSRWLLDRRGKHRGYGDSVRVDGGSPITTVAMSIDVLLNKIPLEARRAMLDVMEQGTRDSSRLLPEPIDEQA